MICRVSEEQLIKAANIMKRWCEDHYYSYKKCDCPFANHGICKIKGRVPAGFEIPCKWTKEDYELAKLLKGKGAKIIKRVDKKELENPVKWLTENKIDGLNGGWIPNGFFELLDIGEEICIDDVIKEYETSKNIFYI